MIFVTKDLIRFSKTKKSFRNVRMPCTHKDPIMGTVEGVKHFKLVSRKFALDHLQNSAKINNNLSRFIFNIQRFIFLMSSWGPKRPRTINIVHTLDRKGSSQ